MDMVVIHRPHVRLREHSTYSTLWYSVLSAQGLGVNRTISSPHR